MNGGADARPDEAGTPTWLPRERQAHQPLLAADDIAVEIRELVSAAITRP